MKSFAKIFLTCSVLTFSALFSMENGLNINIVKPTKKLVSLIPYGYVKFESYFDSRQTVGFRDRQFLLFPARKLCDPVGNDINGHPQFNMTFVETRVGIILDTKELWHNIKISGLIEGDFEGFSEATIGCFRARHAYAEFDINDRDISIITGLYWHPLLILDCFPDTISFNNGAPIELQSRAPQITVIKKWGNLKLTAATCMQFNFTNTGPLGEVDTYIRNAIMPDLTVDMRYRTGKHVFGASGEFKRIVPRIETNKCYAVDESVYSGIFQAYSALNFEDWGIRSKFIYSQNGTDQSLISGYGVSCINPSTDFRKYTPTQAVSLWVDLYKDVCKKVLLGLFAGWTKNLGSMDRLAIDPVTHFPTVYDFGTDFDSPGIDLDYVWRVSPRILFKRNSVNFGVEIEITGAAFGFINTSGKISNPIPVTNFRFLGAMYYNF